MQRPFSFVNNSMTNILNFVKKKDAFFIRVFLFIKKLGVVLAFIKKALTKFLKYYKL